MTAKSLHAAHREAAAYCQTGYKRAEGDHHIMIDRAGDQGTSERGVCGGVTHKAPGNVNTASRGSMVGYLHRW